MVNLQWQWWVAVVAWCLSCGVNYVQGSAARYSSQGQVEQLCTALVKALGCEAPLDDFSPSRVVREACPNHCGGPLRRLQIAKNCTASATMVNLQCIEGNEAWAGEYAVRQGCVDECMAAEKPLPLAFALASTFVLVCCSAFCSGLTLGLMGLDMTMLSVVLESGTDKDKERAAKIAPLRSTGNRLLCVLLITNTAVNAGLAIVMADLTGGFSGDFSA